MKAKEEYTMAFAIHAEALDKLESLKKRKASLLDSMQEIDKKIWREELAIKACEEFMGKHPEFAPKPVESEEPVDMSDIFNIDVDGKF